MIAIFFAVILYFFLGCSVYFLSIVTGWTDDPQQEPPIGFVLVFLLLWPLGLILIIGSTLVDDLPIIIWNIYKKLGGKR